MVDHLGKSSNQIFDVLTEWNEYLEENCADVYDQVLQPPSSP